MSQSFRARTAALLFLVSIVVMGALSLGLGAMVARAQERDQGEALESIARAAASVLVEGLYERMREIALLAASPEVAHAGLDAVTWQPVLDRMKSTRPSFAWIDMVDATGQVQAATGGLLQNATVRERPWFRAGTAGAWVGDVHAAKLLAKLLPAPSDGEPLRFIDFAAPMHDATGALIGVVGAHGSWEWAKEVVQSVRLDRSRERGVQIFIFDRDGRVIHHPRGPGATDRLATLPRPWAPEVVSWSDGHAYLSVAAPLPVRAAVTDLGWTVVVRQPVASALATAAQAREVVLWAGSAGALVVTALTWLVIGRFSLPLRAISAAARRIEAGDLSAAIPDTQHSIELQQLSGALRGMTQTLQERGRRLEDANAHLEARVHERTAELERANAELEQLARKDALTGLFNRRAADDRLSEEMSRHRRSQTDLTLAVLDVDHFKRVNDGHGHPAGDAVLRELAQRLSRTCRSTDFLARIGGEEFLVLMPDTNAAGALAAAEKMRLAVMAEPMPGEVGTVTISLGVAAAAQRFESPADALAIADQALYDAKRDGRNRVVSAALPPATSPTAVLPSAARADPRADTAMPRDVALVRT